MMTQMSLPKTTIEYLDYGAAEGNRNHSLFSAACQFRDSGYPEQDTGDLIERALQDGLTEQEAITTIKSAYAKTPRQKAVTAIAKVETRITVVRPSKKLPDGLPDAITTIFKKCFREGEGVRIALPAQTGISRGACKPVDEWLDMYERDGVSIFGSKGAYVCVNPLLIGGIADKDVIDYRHCLVEFDDGSLEEQYAVLNESGLPLSALIYSGGKSLHGWVKIGANNRNDFDERVRQVYKSMETYRIDNKNKNPSRLSRLPGVRRGGSKQELLGVDLGVENFEEWSSREKAKRFGSVLRFTPNMKPKNNDDSNLVGRRWLCRGYLSLFTGASHIGKSVLAQQMATCWSVGRDFFGLKPVKPLKVVMVNGENDEEQIMENFNGIAEYLKLTEDDYAKLGENFITISNYDKVGKEFLNVAEEILADIKPDILIIDPLLHYINANINDQKVVGSFLRHGLGELAKNHNCAIMVSHHNGKPSMDSHARDHWSHTDMSYLASGTSELVNYPRTVSVLTRKGKTDEFQLVFSKRGNNTGIGESLILKHGEDGIYWDKVVEVQADTAPVSSSDT